MSPEVREPSSEALSVLRAQVEERLRALVGGTGGEAGGVAGAMAAAVLTPGKRLRPLLALLTGRAFGCGQQGLLDLACALELVHCASLVLDDMPAMDNAQLRRGEPTVHLRFGEDVAMLAAVALVTEACRIAAAAPGLAPAVRAQAVQVLCEAIGPNGLVRGQYRDLREGATARTALAAAEANEQKTGVLFAAAMELGARAAARPAAVPALRRAALALGQAFQLLDDLEDADGVAVAPGLPQQDPWQDRGKSTLVQVLGAPASREAVHAHLGQALHGLRQAFGREDPQFVALLRVGFPGFLPDGSHAPAAVAFPLAAAAAERAELQLHN